MIFKKTHKTNWFAHDISKKGTEARGSDIPLITSSEYASHFYFVNGGVLMKPNIVEVKSVVTHINGGMLHFGRSEDVCFTGWAVLGTTGRRTSGCSFNGQVFSRGSPALVGQWNIGMVLRGGCKRK